jgi:hypothetical protein
MRRRSVTRVKIVRDESTWVITHVHESNARNISV